MNVESRRNFYLERTLELKAAVEKNIRGLKNYSKGVRRK